jgi:hypothetical protein
MRLIDDEFFLAEITLLTEADVDVSIFVAIEEEETTIRFSLLEAATCRWTPPPRSWWRGGRKVNTQVCRMNKGKEPARVEREKRKDSTNTHLTIRQWRRN